MTKPHQEVQAQPFFITEDVAAEMAAAHYEFKPSGHARTNSVRDLYGWQFGETLGDRFWRKAPCRCSREMVEFVRATELVNDRTF